ncbi:MAG: flagellar protein FliS [Planctomycetota bacterium]|jgi:flagellar protein FliS
MNPTSAAEAYRVASIENAPPLQIVRLLYQGAMRFLDQAQLDRFKPGDPKYTALVCQADDIIVELRMCLEGTDSEASEVPGNLERLYLYCETELGRAMSEGDKAPLANARRVLEILLDAWNSVELGGSAAA